MADVNLGQLIATTLRKHSSTLADNMSNHIPLLMRLKEKGKVNQYISTGGYEIALPLDYGESNFQRYSGFDLLVVQEAKTFDAATYTPKQAAVPVAISGREERMNTGRAAVIRLLDSKITNADRTMKNNIASDLMSDGTATNQITGLQAQISKTPTSGVVGGIDRASYAFWQNKVRDVTDEFTTYDSDGVRRTWNKMYIDTTRNMDMTDLIVCDANMYEHYENSLQAIQRVTSERKASAGFKALAFKQDVDVIHDSTCPADTAYFLNTNYLEFLTFAGADFESTDMQRPYNQDGSVQHLIFMGNLCMSNAMLQGVVKQ